LYIHTSRSFVSAFFFAMTEISLLQFLFLELGKSFPRLANAAERVTHRNFGVHGGNNLEQHTCGGRIELVVHFVCLQLHHRVTLF